MITEKANYHPIIGKHLQKEDIAPKAKNDMYQKRGWLPKLLKTVEVTPITRIIELKRIITVVPIFLKEMYKVDILRKSIQKKVHPIIINKEV